MNTTYLCNVEVLQHEEKINMSTLLEQAIIDAQTLREAALKNAETTILEKYGDEVRVAVEGLLEAEEDDLTPDEMFGAGMATGAEEAGFEAEPPLAATEGESLCPCPDAEADVEMEFSLEDLKRISAEMETGEPMPQEDLATEFGAEEEEDPFPLQEELDEDIDLSSLLEAFDSHSELHPSTAASREMSDEEIGQTFGAAKQRAAAKRAAEEKPEDEHIEIDENMIKDLVEELVVDVMPTKSGWMATGEGEILHAEELELARRSGTEAQEQISALQDAHDRLTITNESLVKKNKKLTNTLFALKEKLVETNLSSAKLLYMNQALNSASLNERQKSKVVDSIRKADSVEEAKVIFETLQSAAGGSSNRKPKSLSEAIRRPSSTLPRRRKVNSERESLLKERFQRLAGINLTE